MLEARSVAVVGASARPGSFGEQLMLQLSRGGFDGEVYPVNPAYREVMGRACVPSIADVPQPVELVILGVANERLEEQLRAAAAAGARSAVIFASCYEEPEPGRPPLRERLAAIAREAGMTLCGGNGMGFVNVDRGLRACGFTEPDDIGPGPITLITHSGSVFSALLHNDRRIRFNLAVSPGLELTTTVTDYLNYALRLPTTGIVALFIETVRDPDAFRAALAEAERRDVPVVVLKVGREERARELVLAHSGALAGEDAAYQAVFDEHGALRVRSLDEMADTLELLAAGRRAGPGGLAAMHDSGGERAHLIDAAADVDVRFAEISGDTRERLAATLEEGLPAVNPLDAWGTGREHERIYRTCGLALLEDADTAALAFAVDLTTQDPPEGGYLEVSRDVFAATGKPFAVLSNLQSAVDTRDADGLRASGIPVLEGTFTGLRAFRHLFAYRDHRSRPAPQAVDEPEPEISERWRDRLSREPPLSEVEGLAMLADYGIPVVAATSCSSLEEALAAAERIGWPVAMKTAAAGVAHKSDVGGVRLNIGDPDDLRVAYLDVCEHLGPDVTVQAMGPAGVELALGIVRDEQFGPLVMVAAGGVLVEVLRDRSFALCPVDEHRARLLLDRLALRPLLDGVRGAPPARLGIVARAVAGLSVLGRDVGDHLDALDVNPLIAGPDGCVATDVLVVPRGAGRQGAE
jgi:acetate---CoA ligase (ADP-forming)